MNFVTHLPRTEGKTVVLVVVNWLSKYAHFCPMAAGFISESVTANSFETLFVCMESRPALYQIEIRCL
ncbi:unnamed protein product [Rhodiola kirilowii]